MEGRGIADGMRRHTKQNKTSRSGEENVMRKDQSSKEEELSSIYPTVPEEQFTMFQMEELLVFLCDPSTVMLMPH